MSIDGKPTRAIARGKTGKQRNVTGIYMRNALTRRVQLPFTAVGNNVKENLQIVLARRLEGKCAKEGHIKPGSIDILSHSAGIVSGQYAVFDAAFECLVCRPVEGMTIQCLVKNVTKAGVRAETKDTPSPVVIFVARDHHFRSDHFANLTVGGEIIVKVIGIRYELNDEFVSVIGELMEHPPADRHHRINRKKVKITIEKA